MDIRGGIQIILWNGVVCQKVGKVTNGGFVGNVCVKWKSLICKNQNKKNLLIKKYVQYNIDVFQISELCKNHKIFLINKVLKVVL